MPPPVKKEPESYYQLNRLHIVFACISIALLLALVSLFMNDYSREWKDYQNQFRTLDIEKTRVKYDAAENELNDNPEYKALEDKLNEAKKTFQTKCAYLKENEKEINGLKAASDLLNQKYKVKKAQFDAAKFRLEAALSHKAPDTSFTQKEYADLQKITQKLSQQLEDIEKKQKDKQESVDSCAADVKELQKQERVFTQKVTLLERKLNKVDPNNMNFINRVADIIRDLPVIDLSTPKNKIQQIVIKNITDDVNFSQVPKVDRCTSCHLGISNPDYKDFPQPFKTHPNLELFLSNNSAHPLEDMGCTVCHGGRGRGTSFIAAAHTPSSLKQKKEWEEKYHWEAIHHWDEPMLPAPYVEAGCFKCHSGQTSIKGAEQLNLGLQLIEKAGCYNCHTIEKYADWPKSGPDLSKVIAKVSKEFAYRWIEQPHSFRKDTWMPDFFHQSNNNDPESLARTEQEIHAIVEFLFAKSAVSAKDYKLDPIAVTGDKLNGEKLVSSLGCLACHTTAPLPKDTPLTDGNLRIQYGPTLSGLGSKTSKIWLYHWLKNPSLYHPNTRMPNMRLSDQETADITEFLIQGKTKNFDKIPIPAKNEKIIDEIVFDLLKKNASAREAKVKLKTMALNDKLVFAGEKLIAHYGCFACHHIDGFEKAKPIGTELTLEGNKPSDKLDFGFIHIDHSKANWFKQKLLSPRIFDRGKIKSADEKLIMPNFYFSKEEADAITTALLGFVDQKNVKNKMKPRTTDNLAREEGEKIIREFNCQACHIIEGEGGTIAKSIKEWLVKYDNRTDSEAEAVVKNFSPPNLIGEGKKVQTEWLFNFLHEPTTIRPWLKVRMPTFHLNAAHLNALVKYFNSLDGQDFPFPDKINTKLTDEEYTAAEKLFSNEYFGCAQCHIVGNKMPGGSPENWAPNFALAKTRLKPGWIMEWLKNPADLLPGTKMPTYFDPKNFDTSGPEDILNGDEHEQIRVLRNYLMTISDTPAAPATVPQPPKKDEATPATTPTPPATMNEGTQI